MDIEVMAMSDHRAQVGARLRRVLDALGLAYVEAAEIMGTSKQSLTDWMNGRGYPTVYGVYRLNRVHKVTYDYLFLGDWAQLPSKLADAVKPSLGSPLVVGAAAGPEGPEMTAPAPKPRRASRTPSPAS